jgi:hypothetical protein
MEIKDGPVLRLTAPESDLIRGSFIGERDPDAISVKLRLDAVTTLWAQEKLGWSAERVTQAQKGILLGLASSAWAEKDGEVIELELDNDELDIVRENLIDQVELDYSVAMRTPEIVLEDVIQDILYGTDDEIVEDVGVPPLGARDSEQLESHEFRDRLQGIALGRYMLETIDKHIESQD